MLRSKIPLLLVALMLACAGSQSQSLPLLRDIDLVYLGGFTVPMGSGNAVFDYGGMALLYRPSTDTLMAASKVYSVGSVRHQDVSEFTVQAPVNGPVSSMTRATTVQPFTDVTQGKLLDSGFGPQTTLGGLLVDATGRLIVTVYSAYDASGSGQTKSHLISGTEFSMLPTVGPPSVVYGAPTQPKYAKPAFTSGAMVAVPSGYQASLGKPFLTGQCCLNVIPRTSWGPSLTTFDPALLNPSTPQNGMRVVGYDDVSAPTHQTLGTLTTGVLFNGTAQVAGVVWPSTTRSVLFVGRIGTPPVVYGTGTDDPAKAGYDADGSQTPPYTPCPQKCANPWVYDPVNSAHGYHGYPYHYMVWAYDADDFVAVKAGTKQPWQVIPYATWTPPVPDSLGLADVQGATYKETTRQLFLTARSGDDGARPVVYVFQLP